MNVYLSVDFKQSSLVIRSPQIILQKILPTLTFTLRYGPVRLGDSHYKIAACLPLSVELAMELTIAKRKWKRHIYLGHDHRKKFHGVFVDDYLIEILF